MNGLNFLIAAIQEEIWHLFLIRRPIPAPRHEKETLDSYLPDVQ